MRNTTIDTIYERAKEDPNIFLIVGDLGYSVVGDFAKELPDQVINVGISEQNMIGVAAGLALDGAKVFVYSIAPFVTMRCFEQIRIDVCYQNLDVNLIGVGGGFAYGTLGTTHHAIEDVAIMRSLPNMKIISPADKEEARFLVKDVLDSRGPFYVRLNRGGEENISGYSKTSESIRIGKNVEVRLGNDMVLFASGNILEVAVKVSDNLKKSGIGLKVISVHSLKPLDSNNIKKEISNKKAVFTLEEHNIIGGLGSAVSEIIAEGNVSVKFKRFGVEDKYLSFIGKQDYLRGSVGLSVETISKTINNIYENK